MVHTKIAASALLAVSSLAQNVGPIRDLRIPVYDFACEAKIGKPTSACYKYLRLPAEAHIEADPLGISDGILWVAAVVAAPGTNSIPGPEFLRLVDVPAADLTESGPCTQPLGAIAPKRVQLSDQVAHQLWICRENRWSQIVVEWGFVP